MLGPLLSGEPRGAPFWGCSIFMERSEVWERVQAFLEEERLEEALAEAERLRSHSPDSAEVRALEGIVRGQLGELDRAFSLLDEALTLDPGLDEARIEKARLLFDEERYEDVIETLQGLEDTEALLLTVSALYELGEHEEARVVCAEALAQEETAELRQLEALLHLQQAEPEKALAPALRSVELDPELAEGRHSLALVLTQLGRVEEADAAFARAAELEPDRYFVPERLRTAEFDDVVEEALGELPEEFDRFLENVEVAVEDVPAPELVREGIEFDLLGLYQGGTIQSEAWDLPDRVLLFQRNLENVSPDRETLIEEIRDTVFHEVAHHMGMDEDEVRESEEAWLAQEEAGTIDEPEEEEEADEEDEEEEMEDVEDG